MAAVKQKDTEYIVPAFPVHEVGVFFFVRTSVAVDRRISSQRHHGEATVCGVAGARFYWEQEVYEDSEGERWIIDPWAMSQGLNGWRPTQPCPRCGDSQVGAILAERTQWQEQGSCFGTMMPSLMGNEMTPEIREFCGHCPVELLCRSYGRRLHRATPDGIKGIYGGETEGQRNAYQSA